MNWRATVALMVAALAIGAVLYQVSYAVEGMHADLDRLNQRIRADREAIHVLQAEWSYLNQPQRLAKLSERYLGMAPADASRIVDASALAPPAAADGALIAAARPAGSRLGLLRPSAKPRPPPRGVVRQQSNPHSTLVASIARAARRTFDNVTSDLLQGLRRWRAPGPVDVARPAQP